MSIKQYLTLKRSLVKKKKKNLVLYINKLLYLYIWYLNLGFEILELKNILAYFSHFYNRSSPILTSTS